MLDYYMTYDLWILPLTINSPPRNFFKYLLRFLPVMKTIRILETTTWPSWCANEQLFYQIKCDFICELLFANDLDVHILIILKFCVFGSRNKHVKLESLNFWWDSNETIFKEIFSISRNFRLVKKSEVFKTIRVLLYILCVVLFTEAIYKYIYIYIMSCIIYWSFVMKSAYAASLN